MFQPESSVASKSKWNSAGSSGHGFIYARHNTNYFPSTSFRKDCKA